MVSLRQIVPTMVGSFFWTLVGKPDTHFIPNSFLSFIQAVREMKNYHENTTPTMVGFLMESEMYYIIPYMF